MPLGGIGQGAYWNGHRFNGAWNEVQEQRIYSGKNYVTWGHCWAGKKMMAHYYNQAGCDIWRRGSSRKRDLMVLIRSLYDIAAS